jgi:hypothetical protein
MLYQFTSPHRPLNVHTVTDQSVFDPTLPPKPQKVAVDRSEQCRQSRRLARKSIRLSNSEIYHHTMTSAVLHGKESQCRWLCEERAISGLCDRQSTA